MGLPSPKEERRFERFKLQGRNLPGHLFISASGEFLAAIAIDVSKQGLGIAAGVILAVGTELELRADGRVVSLRVVWNKQGRKDLARHGLQVTSLGVDLEELFFAHGCIDLDFSEVLMQE